MVINTNYSINTSQKNNPNFGKIEKVRGKAKGILEEFYNSLAPEKQRKMFYSLGGFISRHENDQFVKIFFSTERKPAGKVLVINVQPKDKKIPVIKKEIELRVKKFKKILDEISEKGCILEEQQAAALKAKKAKKGKKPQEGIMGVWAR